MGGGLLSVGEFLVTEFFDRELPAFAALPNSLRARDFTFTLGLFLFAVILAVGFLAYRRAVPERLARELFARNIFSQEEALSCADLSIKLSLALRFSLHNRFSGLRRCVLIAGEDAPDLAKKTRAERKAAQKEAKATRANNPFVALKNRLFPDLSQARFYLAPDRAEEIERRYKHGFNVTPKVFCWTAAVCVVLFFVLCRLLPSILLLIDKLIG